MALEVTSSKEAAADTSVIGAVNHAYQDGVLHGAASRRRSEKDRAYPSVFPCGRLSYQPATAAVSQSAYLQGIGRSMYGRLYGGHPAGAPSGADSDSSVGRESSASGGLCLQKRGHCG
ncbi:hypothetical protein MPNT_10246 [Candidatus Methylacidithermus pantelleriae]|uniref:Uncharacterized protein n=1 Tax=Candidatus Methylacidithermus pantelleriae TaxID=2744239 RepID=A0A8J2BIN7_9BACT|nr:hypothetical protein MPNT_10246 [Candidatus Methylacidithermus pantelleriae]